MHTKILYTVVNKPGDNYSAQALLSATTLLKHNPAAEIIVVSDRITSSNPDAPYEELLKLCKSQVIVDTPDGLSQIQRSRYLKTTMRQYVDGNFLFIDCDTIICSQLDAIDGFGGNLGMVIDTHWPTKSSTLYAITKPWLNSLSKCNLDGKAYYNSGVMFVRDCEVTRNFFKRWHQLWEESSKKGVNYDQPALHFANEDFNIIESLEGEWNVQLSERSLPYLNGAHIFHYYNSRSKKGLSNIFSIDEILSKIKRTGTVDSEIKNLMNKPQSLFEANSRIIGKEEIQITSSLQYELMRKIFIKHIKVFGWIEGLLRMIITLKSKKYK
jgi:lipopolysaccharide biosynthesis glycosyltransferase